MTKEAQTYETQCPELELLAALLDNRLEGDERVKVVEHLSRCESCYEIFTETLRFQEEETQGGRVLVLPTQMRRWLWAATGVAAAAMFAVIVAFPLWQNLRDDAGAIAVSRLAENLVAENEATTLMPLAYSGDGWSRTRGFGTGLNETQRAFRLGVRTVDLEVSLRAGDGQRAERLLHELSVMAQDLPLPEMILVSYGDLLARLGQGEAPQALTQRSAQAAALVNDAAEAPYYAMGQWAESGLLAASAGDTEFFNQRPVRRFATDPEAAELPDELRAPLTTISGQLEQRVDAADLPRLSEAFAELVESGGNA